MTNPYEMINGESVQMSDAEYSAFQAMQTAAASAQVITSLVNSAMAALAESDKTMLRVQEAISLGLTTATTADVVTWVNYRRSLRSIVSSQSGTLPSKPSYPANT